MISEFDLAENLGAGPYVNMPTDSGCLSVTVANGPDRDPLKNQAVRADHRVWMDHDSEGVRQEQATIYLNVEWNIRAAD